MVGDMIRLLFKGIAYDINSNPIVLLTDESEDRVLPIWIGTIEAHSIALAMEGSPIQRPMTHDLIFTLLDQFDATITSVVISDMQDNTFHANLNLRTANGEIVLDARPSDALALALRASAPVFLNENLYTNMLELKDIFDDEMREELEKILNSDTYPKNKKSLH